MKRELDAALVRDFPLTFARDSRGREPWSMFGFECSDGWEPSIRKTAEKLEPLFAIGIVETSLPNFIHKITPKAVIKFLSRIAPSSFLLFLTRNTGYFRTAQLKEKFGTGRWYLSCGTDEMHEIVSAWELETDTICETCGKPGELRGRGWLYTACFDHAKVEDRDSLEIVERASEEKEKNNG